MTGGCDDVPIYTRKGGHHAAEPGEEERVDADESVARVLVRIPNPRRHFVRYHGACSNRAMGQRQALSISPAPPARRGS